MIDMTGAPMAKIDVSFEFFPPKAQADAAKCAQARAALAAFGPDWCSVTSGAGGSTKRGTSEAVAQMLSEGIRAAPHVSCLGSSRGEIVEALEGYKALGVRRVVALRGDLPSGYGVGAAAGGPGHANELVELIRARFGGWFEIHVAAYPEVHPQARSPKDDLERFAAKMAAGADSAITQYFYNADAYFRFAEEASKLGVSKPIVPGIMPITNSSQLMRFSDMCGAEVPRWIRLRLAEFGDDKESIRAFGLDAVASMCRRLLDGGAPGLHFYTMNQARATSEILGRLGIPRAA